MKKTYVTTMPDHVGAFLKASRCMAALGLNITRVSYTKAIDIHTLFIEADGAGHRGAAEDWLPPERRGPQCAAGGVQAPG